MCFITYGSPVFRHRVGFIDGRSDCSALYVSAIKIIKLRHRHLNLLRRQRCLKDVVLREIIARGGSKRGVQMGPRPQLEVCPQLAAQTALDFIACNMLQ